MTATALGGHLEKVSPSQVKLLEASLAQVRTGRRRKGLPNPLIAGRGDDRQDVFPGVARHAAFGDVSGLLDDIVLVLLENR